MLQGSNQKISIVSENLYEISNKPLHEPKQTINTQRVLGLRNFKIRQSDDVTHFHARLCQVYKKKDTSWHILIFIRGHKSSYGLFFSENFVKKFSSNNEVLLHYKTIVRLAVPIAQYDQWKNRLERVSWNMQGNSIGIYLWSQWDPCIKQWVTQVQSLKLCPYYDQNPLATERCGSYFTSVFFKLILWIDILQNWS